MKTIREAAHIAGRSNSAFIASAIADAMATRRALTILKDDAASLDDGTRRGARVSTILERATHARMVECGMGLTAHAFAQAAAVKAAERLLASRATAVGAMDTRPVDKWLGYEITALADIFASQLEAGHYSTERAEALRAKIANGAATNKMRQGHARADARRHLDRLPMVYRDKVLGAAGWLLMAPEDVLRACVARSDAKRLRDTVPA